MEGWKKIVLGAIGKKFYSGGTPSTKVPSYWNGDIEWITSKWLTDKLYLVNGEKFISLKGLQNSASKLVPKRSLIVATRVGVGKVCINQINIAINQDLFGIEINEEEYSLEFLAYQLRSETIQNYINSFKRGATIQGVTKDCIKSILINLPPLPEQRKIAYVLSTVQKAIEQQDKLIRTTTELKKALMQKLFTEGLYGEKQKETEIGLVPESWEVVRIGDMYDFTSKPRGLAVNLPVGFIPMEMIPLNKIYINSYELRDKFSSGTYIENGDLLLAKITPSFENGKQGIVSIDIPYAYATTEVIPIKKKKNISNKYFLFYYLLKDDIRGLLTGKMEGSTGRQRLSKTVLSNTLIPKPTLKEQEEIANVFKAFDNRIEHYQKKKQTLQDLFNTLLHELMTEQRRVNEIDFTGAETLEAPITNNKQKEHPLNKRKE